jgi:glutamyl-tRNA reductase
MTNISIDNTFQRLSANAVCYFIDYKTVSKKTVYQITSAIDPVSILDSDVFIVHTCLRLEIYSFRGELSLPPRLSLAKLSGPLAVRRLLSLMCGTQSEIVGEREIIGQVKKGIIESVQEGYMSRSIFWLLFDLIAYAEKLRSKYNVNSDENYSTVGADMFNRLITSHAPVISIIGSGYMAEYFLRKIDLHKAAKINWINRNVDKARALQRSYAFLDAYNINHISIANCELELQNSDFIFAATTNTDGLFGHCILRRPTAIVDVSYPPLFSEFVNDHFYCINNTFFERYISTPVLKTSLLAIEQKIDSLLQKYA